MMEYIHATSPHTFKVEEANTFFKRFLGLMGRKSLKENHGLVLDPCNSVHTFFMNFTIDVVYLDKDLKVLKVETMKPRKVGRIVPKCKKILELNEGEGSFIQVNDQFIEWRDNDEFI